MENANPAKWHSDAIHATSSAALGGSPPMEHRWGRRRPCRARVRVSALAGVAGSARFRNVSFSGAFLETGLPLPLHSQVAIALLGDGGSTPSVALTATVVRTDPDGVGIEWCELAAGPICRLLGCTIDCGAVHE